MRRRHFQGSILAAVLRGLARDVGACALTLAGEEKPARDLAPTTEIRGHDQVITSVCIDGEGTRVGTGSHDETCAVWDAASGEALGLFTQECPVNAVALSRDGGTFAAGLAERKVRTRARSRGVISNEGGKLVIWNHGFHKDPWILGNLRIPPKSLAFNDAGTLIGALDYRYILKLWSLDSGEQVALLKGHESQGQSGLPVASPIAFSSDLNRVISLNNALDPADKGGLFGNKLRLWDVKKNRTRMIEVADGNFVAVTLSPNGMRIAAGKSNVTTTPNSRSGKRPLSVVTLDFESGAVIRTISLENDGQGGIDETHAPYFLAYSPDGRHLIVARSGLPLALYGAEQGDFRKNLDLGVDIDCPIRTLRFTRSEVIVAVGGFRYTRERNPRSGGQMIEPLSVVRVPHGLRGIDP